MPWNELITFAVQYVLDPATQVVTNIIAGAVIIGLIALPIP